MEDVATLPVADPFDGGSLVLPSPAQPLAVARMLVGDCLLCDDVYVLRRWRGGWWRWERTHWSEIEDTVADKIVYDYTEHAQYFGKDGDLLPWAPTRFKVGNVQHALGSIIHLDRETQPPAWTMFVTERPKARDLVSVRNGLLHVQTRELYPHDARLFNTVTVPFNYDPHAAAPARWLSFLGELWRDDSDSIALLQEFFGYVISGRTDLQKILLLVGPPRAGKGVITRILEALVGRGNCAGPTLASLGTNFGLQPLLGKPLAVVSDARLGQTNSDQVVERLLSISGEDMLTVDRKYQEPWTGTLPTRFVIVSNELPRFGDASGAIARRFAVLNATTSFLGRENPNLTSELLEELPGILNWALDGLERIAATNTFTEPASSRDTVVMLQDLVSPIAAFIREVCERTGDVDCDVLYQVWCQWAEDNGHHATSVQRFRRDLHAAVPNLRTMRPRAGTDNRRPRRYVGISLNHNY